MAVLPVNLSCGYCAPIISHGRIAVFAPFFPFALVSSFVFRGGLHSLFSLFWLVSPAPHRPTLLVSPLLPLASVILTYLWQAFLPCPFPFSPSLPGLFSRACLLPLLFPLRLFFCSRSYSIMYASIRECLDRQPIDLGLALFALLASLASEPRILAVWGASRIFPASHIFLSYKACLHGVYPIPSGAPCLPCFLWLCAPLISLVCAFCSGFASVSVSVSKLLCHSA